MTMGEIMPRKQQHNDCALLDMERLRLDLQSHDEATRLKAVRSICPCHAGWEPFEQHMKIVAELQKDTSLIVRNAAKHVFEDAAEMESSGYQTNPREVTNEMLRTRRASRFPREPEEIAHKAQSKRRAEKIQNEHNGV